MAKSIAILQSNYIPWKGYFDIIAAVDEFVLFDEVQYTRRDWRNRNRIILDRKPHWLSIPVASKGRFDSAIDEMVIADPDWSRKHLATIQHAYRRAPFFDALREPIWRAFEEASSMETLSAVNEVLLRALSSLLGIETRFENSRAAPRISSDPTDRLVEICLARGATEYLSGPAARAYIRHDAFKDAGVRLSYADYSGYPAYAQMSATFEPGVSLLDLLFSVGPAASDHLKSRRDRASFVRPAES